MRTAGWLGPMIVVAGLLVGALVAGGMSVTSGHGGAEATPATGPAALPAPVTLQAGPGDAAQGRAAFQRNCASCHGTEGKGDVPLHGPLISAYYKDDRVLAGLIRNGFGTMPGTSADLLTDQQVADTIAFLRALP